MSEIRIQKIDGVEFVSYTDYLRLKEEKQELEYLGDINEELKEENQKLKIIIENTKKEQKSDREHIEELEEENQKLKDEVKDLVERNIELNKKYMLVLTKNKKLEENRDERKRKEECSNVIIDFVKEKGKENGWTI